MYHNRYVDYWLTHSSSNYLIGALRETPPHRDFVEYGSKQTIKIPNDAQRLPESPIYCGLQGFRTITKVLSPGSETYGLLDTLRVLTNNFYIENGHYSSSAPSPFRYTSFCEGSDETVSSLYIKIFAIESAADKDFKDMNARYTFESIRLTSLVYAHALANKIPFSVAAAQVRSTSKPDRPSIDSDESTPMPIQIKNALMRTDTSHCWDHLAGVLFWVALIASAAANPGPINNEERVGEDEDARKWLAAIAVRCSITLSFQYGHAVLETLKRFVAIETVLGRRGAGARSWSPESVGNPSTTSPKPKHRPFGPVEPPMMQRGFADYAQDFMNI